MSKNSRRAGSACTAAGLMIAFMPAVQTASAQQLDYDRTTFLHGLGSSPAIWRATWPELGGVSTRDYLRRTIKLGPDSAPNLFLDSTFVVQQQTLNSFVGREAGANPTASNRHVFIGHSLGGLVARGAYAANPERVAGIVAVATPHRGVIIADSGDLANAYLKDFTARLESAKTAAKQLGYIVGIVPIIGLWPADALISGSHAQLPNTTGATAGLRVPALRDLSRTSGVIAGSAVVQGGFANYVGDAGLPRATVNGRVPFGHAILRLAAVQDPTKDSDAEFRALKRRKDNAVKGLRKCRNLGYGIIVGSDQARRCGRGADALVGLDARYAGFINGTENGIVRYDAVGYGRLPVYGQVPRNIPFDGVVPEEQSRYPGLTDANFVFTALETNHQNIYRVERGVIEIGRAMLRIGMESTGQPLSSVATISAAPMLKRAPIGSPRRRAPARPALR